MSRLPIEQALQIIQSAFLPLRCRAQAWGDGKKARFRVFDAADSALMRFPYLTKSQVTDPVQLEAILTESRRRLGVRGYRLNAWKFPA
jgi:hypothetical protein